MAEVILTSVVNKKISIDEFFEWLTAETPENVILPDILQNESTRTDFIFFFLNYLREQCKSVLPDLKETKQKCVDKPKTDGEVSTPIANRNQFPAQDSGFETQKHPNDYTKHFKGKVTAGTVAMTVKNFPLLALPQTTGSPLLNNAGHRVQQNDHSDTSHIQRNQLQRNSDNSSKRSIQVTSPEHAHNSSVNSHNPTGTSSPYNSPAVNASSPNQSNELLDLSFSNVSMDASSPLGLKNSIKNVSSIVNSSFVSSSPVSPLYANNTSILCPRRSVSSFNESRNSRDNSCSLGNNSRTSTPKGGTSTGRKRAPKSAQKQTLCLGDFLKSDDKSSHKNSRSQYGGNPWEDSHSKINAEDETTSEMEKISSESLSRNSKTKSKRRIKPTRLNVSCDKESLGKEVFGVISRPTTANPQFIEAPASDKSQEELPFEVERGLLKLERQRQPKSEATIEVASSEPKLANKMKSESTISPCLDLVENAETLDVLALLYGGILHRNLMPNPMTELYFLMTLLTNQYKAAVDREIVAINKDARQVKTSPAKSFDTLKDDLGCAELPDDAITENNNEGTRKSRKADESRDDLDDSITDIRRCAVEYLNTAHNCVYFATKVMLHGNYLLSILDRPTLKLLCENQQIATFQPDLQKKLNDIYSVKCSQTNRSKQTDSGNSQTNVCFQVDTDNLDKFPSFMAFSLFRKQRDGFYEILKQWEDDHLKPNWSYERVLSKKINALLTPRPDAVNYCQLAKLFVSQLLISCGQNGRREDPMDDESLMFLKSLKHLNPEKLLQLKERLVTPLTSMDPVPQPTFPGVQEFYKEFISNACDWNFCVILENVFIREIMELNGAQFARSEIEEGTVDESTKQNFITCVSSLRLLAKFTSFMLTLPFKSEANSPDWLVSQIQLRGSIVPSLDLRSCLFDALRNHRLSLVVPWIVQYMAMLDPVTLRLPYYVNIGEILYCIYRLSNRENRLENISISPQTSMLMIFTIGWLFELPNFPRELYAHWQMKYDVKKLETIVRMNNPPEKSRNMISTNEEIATEFVEYQTSLDELDILDDRALYECCPFLTQFKILLISGNTILSNSNANRHITPVSSKLPHPSFCVKTKNLQMQLEEAFLHGQPSSVRKTIDFVSERIASSCVKYICKTVIPESKERNVKNYIKSNNFAIETPFKSEDPEEEPEESSRKLPRKRSLNECRARELATRIKESVKRECSQKIPAMCEARTIKAIESLLPDDAVSSVKETCTAIAKRIAMERIEQWIDSHVHESLFLKNLDSDLITLSEEGNRDLADRENRHNPDAPSPHEVICTMRNSMWELLEKKNRWSELSVGSVLETVEGLRQTSTARADYVACVVQKIYTMSVEYCLLLITHRPDLFTMDVQKKFLSTWKSYRVEGLFVRLVSPRNIRLLTTSSDPSVMKVFGQLLKGLLREDLLNIEALSEQCVALFRQEWPEQILKQLAQCLKDVVSDCKCSGVHAEGIKYLLGWIATTCEHMEMYDW